MSEVRTFTREELVRVVPGLLVAAAEEMKKADIAPHIRGALIEAASSLHFEHEPNFDEPTRKYLAQWAAIKEFNPDGAPR